MRKSQLKNIISKATKKVLKEAALNEQAMSCEETCQRIHDLDYQAASVMEQICTLLAVSQCELAYPIPPHNSNDRSNCVMNINQQQCWPQANNEMDAADNARDICLAQCPPAGTGNGGGGETGGGSCFIAGTKVKMADGTNKNIEDVEIDEEILGQNGANKVIDYDRPKLGDRKLYSFNGGKAFVTSEHPFMTEGGWKSIDPEETLKENPNLTVAILNIGDVIITDSESITIESIESHEGNAENTVYNFKLDGDHSYYADGYLVHNKEILDDEGFAFEPGWDPGIDGSTSPGHPSGGIKGKIDKLEKLKQKLEIVNTGRTHNDWLRPSDMKETKSEKLRQLRKIIRESIKELMNEQQPGDGNNDGVVNAADQILVVTNWLRQVATGTNGDVIGSLDGLVDNDDLSLVLNNWLAGTNNSSPSGFDCASWKSNFLNLPAFSSSNQNQPCNMICKKLQIWTGKLQTHPNQEDQLSCKIEEGNTQADLHGCPCAPNLPD